MSGTYIHLDGTDCDHGFDVEKWSGAASWDSDLAPLAAGLVRILPPAPRPLCRDGVPLMGYRLDPDQPVPPWPGP